MKRKSKVYLHMFLSYLCILIIPLVIGGMIYAYALRVIRSQAEKMNTTMLEMIQRDLDQQVDEVRKIASRLALDTRVQMISKVNDKFEMNDQLSLYYLFQDLQAIDISEDFVDDVFIYFSNTQKVSSIKGNMGAELYYDLYYKTDQYTMDQFRDYMGEFHYNDMLVMTRTDGTEILLFTMTALNSSIGEKTATICITIDFEAIKNRLNSMKWNDRMEVFIINSQNDHIPSLGNGQWEQELQYEKLMPGNQMKQGTAKEPFIITVLESKNSDWKYVALTPAAIFEKEAKTIQKITIVGLFGCIVVAFWISGYLAKKNYNPLKLLMDNFKKHGDDEMKEGEDEYQWLNAQINQVFKAHIDAEHLLDMNQKSLRNYYLFLLLQDYHEGEIDKIRRYGIRLKLNYNIVLLFIPALFVNREHRDAEAYIEKNALQKFVIINVFEEMLSVKYNVELVEMGERVAAIVNLPDQESHHVEILKEIGENLQQLVEASFGFSCSILFGSICPGLNGVHVSYLQAEEAEEYVNLLDTDLIIYDDVKNIQPQYNYSVEAEQKIIQAIKVGDCEQAKICMLQVFELNFREQVTPSIYRCLIFDMIGTLLRGASLGGYMNAAQELDFPDDLSIKQGQLKQKFEELLNQICNKVLERQKEISLDQALSKKVQEYICKNYEDPDLNISITSQQFDITPAYLSSIYKKQTGGSLLDYINSVRIDRAEELLEAGCSVVEVAQKTGFRDSGSFIRIFKKKRGITPGQLKKKF